MQHKPTFTNTPAASKPRIAGILLLFILATMAACTPGKKEKEGNLDEKKAELAELKKAVSDQQAAIAALEKEIAATDPAAPATTPLLVALDTITTTDFSHYIELQGKIDADDISYITPRGGPGQVKAIYVKKGDRVSKGQLILKLDDRIIKQQVEPLKVQLELAKDIYQRRQNLWKQGIGSEVELLSAKTNVDQLERQIAIVEEQGKTTNVVSDVNGVVDELNVRVGELFTGAMQVKVVNTSSLKAVTFIPENYLARVNKGSKVLVQVPDVNRSYNSAIRFVSASIDPASRSFITEAALPSDPMLKPNLIAIMKVLDYSAPNAVAIPVNLIQSDESGKYVFVSANENGKLVARKKPVILGQMQNDVIEIKAGLASGDVVVSQGYQGLYDGQLITTRLM